MRYRATLLGFMIIFHSAANSHETTPTFDRVSLSASASTEVLQNELQATLYAISEGEDANPTAAEVSQRIQKALSILERQKEIKVQTGVFNTQPVYNEDKITGWRTRQTLHLKSVDAAQLSQLLGRLQNHLNVDQIQYGVSDTEWFKSENALIEEALKNFQHRASLITHGMHREKYRLIDIHVSSNHAHPRFMRSAGTAVVQPESAPPVQAGSEKIEIMINGTIEMQLNP